VNFRNSDTALSRALFFYDTVPRHMVFFAQTSQTVWSPYPQRWTVKRRIEPLSLEDEATTPCGNVWRRTGRDRAQYPGRTELQNILTSHSFYEYICILLIKADPSGCAV